MPLQESGGWLEEVVRDRQWRGIIGEAIVLQLVGEFRLSYEFNAFKVTGGKQTTP